MSFTPEQSAIKVTKSLEEQIVAANSQSEISALLRAAAVAQGAAHVDAFNPDILYETGRTLPTRVAKVVRINGVAHPLEADSPEELSAKEAALFRELFGGDQQQQVQQQQVEQPRDEQGRFISQEQLDAAEQQELVRRSELEQQWRRGEIDSTTYLTKSGAISDFLAARGIDVDAASNQAFENQWADATEEFKARHPEWDRFAGEEAKSLLGQLIIENDLVEQPSVETLERCYQFAVANGMLKPTAEGQAVERIETATSASEIHDALNAFRPGGSSGFFGR